MIGEPDAVNDVGPEILYAHDTDKGARLEIFGVDIRLLDLAPIDLRLDDLALDNLGGRRQLFGSY